MFKKANAKDVELPNFVDTSEEEENEEEEEEEAEEEDYPFHKQLFEDETEEIVDDD